MSIAAIEPLPRVARTPGAPSTIIGFRRARTVCEYQFETSEEIASDLISGAGSLLALRWQACFVRQFEGGRWDDSECRLISVAGDVPLRVMQLKPRSLSEVRVLDATIIPIEHAGRLSGIWLLGAQRHGAHLGPAQVGEVADLVRPAAAALEVTVLRAWAKRLRDSHAAWAEDSAESLTARQLEVARLVGRGFTNHQIALALGISPGTAAKHIEHIMARLDIESRSQIAVWAHRSSVYRD